MQISLKKIEVSQSIELHELAVQTFDETFAAQNSPMMICSGILKLPMTFENN